MTETYIVDEDIRLKLAKYNDTMIQGLADTKLKDILKKIGDISVVIAMVSNEFKDSNIYSRGNEIFTNNITDYNKYLGAAYGYEVLVVDIPNDNVDELLQTLLNNIGKFQQVIILNTKNFTIGAEPTLSLDLGDSITVSYSGFISYFESLTVDQLLTDTSGILVLMFPTTVAVPDETPQRIDLTLTRIEVNKINDDNNSSEDQNDTGNFDLVFKCDIFHNSKFIEKALYAFFLLLQSFGVFFVDNTFYVFDYDLYDQYIVSQKHPRVYEIFLRVLIFMNSFSLMAQHDNFKSFLLRLISEYQVNYNDNWQFY